jgi:hypothetical protein
MLTLACGKDKKENIEQMKSDEMSHQWTEKEMLEFERNCIGSLESEGVENAKVYCDCLLESSLEAYPDPAEAIELEQKDIVALFEKSNCLDDLLMIKIEDPWTEEVEEKFLEHCKIAQIKKGETENGANDYCSCALEEIKKIVPNPQHVMALTQDELDHILEKCNGK